MTCVAELSDDSVVAISDDENDFYSKPIIKLFKRLIDNETKENTVLTNIQILDLLKIEFDIDIQKLHSLEVDIYINLTKKFLKDWPKWPEFDAVVSQAKTTKDSSLITKMLHAKHKDLKEYLQEVTEIAKPLAQEAVLKAKSQSSKVAHKEEKHTDGSVVLEILASRPQLNKLFLKRPNNNSIFNTCNEQQSKITVTDIKTAAVMNWWDVNLELKVTIRNNLVTIYKREMVHELKHTLINKKLNQTNPLMELDQELHVKQSKVAGTMDGSLFIGYIDKVMAKATDEEREIFEFIKKDMFLMPNTLLTQSLYKRYLNKYSYVRYLCADDDIPDNDKYDLRLEEIVMPAVKISIGNFDYPELTDNHYLVVTCTSCAVSFSGPVILTDLKAHFQNHMSEPPFVCTKCKAEYSMLSLAQTWWCHRC